MSIIDDWFNFTESNRNTITSVTGNIGGAFESLTSFLSNPLMMILLLVGGYLVLSKTLS